jgi:SET and MYND domain-containing protein
MRDFCFLQVTVPYLDAALPYKRRQEICRYSYGFTCTCQSCSLSEQWDKAYEINTPPEDASARAQLDSMLYHFVLQNSSRSQATPTPATPLSSLSFPYRLSWPTNQLFPHLPQALLPILHETYLPTLSSAFRTAAHDGPVEEALRTGRTLLAFYEVAYPPMYPQTGTHELLDF